MAELRQVPAGTDSQPAAPASSRSPTILGGAGRAQNEVDLQPEVPLHLKPVLNGYAEVVALGICSERALRRHLATGRVRRSVIRNGRNLRFVKDVLITELLEAGE